MGYESVGGIWIKKSKAGKEYFSISIGDERYVAFPNYKKQGNQPDYRIIVSEPMPDYPKKQEPPPPEPSPLDSDIPF